MIKDARPAAYPTRRYNRRPMATAPSTAAHWEASLDLGDHDAAMAAWQSRYAGREHEVEARRVRCSAHLPASRWEPDGRDGFEAADALRATLAAGRDPGEAPAWARELLAGRLLRSLPTADESGEPQAFAPLFDLLLAAAPQLEARDRRWI